MSTLHLHVEFPRLRCDCNFETYYPQNERQDLDGDLVSNKDEVAIRCDLCGKEYVVRLVLEEKR